MKIQHTVAVATLALSAAWSVQAADVYVGAAGGVSKLHIADEQGVQVDRSDTGYKVLVGVAIGPNLAVEGGYMSLGKAKYSGTLNATPVSGDVQARGPYVDVLGKLPLSAGWGLYGKLGVLHGKTKGTVSGVGSASDSDTALRYGLGAEYAFTKSVAGRLEWERSRFKAFGDKFDGDLVSLGVTVGF